MRRLCALLVLVVGATLEVSAQRVVVDNLPSHVIVDSCAGCGGGGSSSDISTAAAITGVVGQNIDLTFTQPTATVAVGWDAAWSGTVSWFASVDGSTYRPTLCVDATSGTVHSSAYSASGSARSYTCPVAGFSGFRVNVTVWTSGTPTVTIRGTSGHWGDPFASQFLSAISTNTANTYGQLVAGVTVAQGDGTQLHITCDSGCGSPPATADGTAFTAGVTNVSPIAALVDDTATTTVAEDAYGAPRMTPSRVLYADLSQTGANATAIKVDGSAVTQPVSGTFWQATQPVSGTFWQATQPVSVTNVVDVSGSAVDVTGSAVSVSNAFLLNTTYTTRTPAGASPANGESNTNTSLSRVGTFPFVFNGATWDRWTGAVTGSGNFTVVQATAANLNATVTGTVTTTPPSNASTNVAQLAGTATSVNSGVKDAGTLRVVIATDQPALTNKLLVTPDSVALPANQSVNVAQFGGTNVSTGTGASGTGIPRVTVSNDSNVIVTPPTLTKATQGATGFSVQALKDAGRTAKSFYANNIASGTTGTETLITLTQSSGTSATSSAASYTITNGKTFRIEQIQVGSRGHATATIQISTFNLRMNTGGACVVGSTPILMGIATATPATASAWDRSSLPLTDGYEIVGNGTISICISANAVFVTNAPTWFVNIIGYEY